MDLGMGVTYLDPGSSQMGKKESIEDLQRGYSAACTTALSIAALPRRSSKIWRPMRRPRLERLTTEFHPTQALADVLTMREEFGSDLKGRKVVFMGQVGNTADSLAVICAKLGINFVQCGPQSDVEGNRTYQPWIWRSAKKQRLFPARTLA